MAQVQELLWVENEASPNTSRYLDPDYPIDTHGYKNEIERQLFLLLLSIL